MDSPATLAVSSGEVATDSSVRSTRRTNAAPQSTLRPNPEFAHSPVADELVARLKNYQRQSNNNAEQMARNEALVRNAYAIACEAHGKQKRDSGEPYIDHPVAVAHILIDLQLDAASIAAALLHDVLEDTLVTKEQLTTLFGAEIANLVDGVTKLSALEARTREEAQVGTYRKMFIAMADDPRVVLVKLADRLHNMRTVSSLSEERQKRMARENARNLCAPGASPRYLADQVGTRRPRIRCAQPRKVSRDQSATGAAPRCARTPRASRHAAPAPGP